MDEEKFSRHQGQSHKGRAYYARASIYPSTTAKLNKQVRAYFVFFPQSLAKRGINSTLEEEKNEISQGEDISSVNFYSIEILQSRQWPEDIVVTEREKYLSNSDFLTLFNMDKSIFL